MKIVPVTSLVVHDSVRVVCMVELRSIIRQFKFKVFPGLPQKVLSVLCKLLIDNVLKKPPAVIWQQEVSLMC